MDEDDGAATTYRLRPAYVAASTAVGIALTVLVHVLFDLGGLGAMIGVAVGLPLALRAQGLTLSAEGVVAGASDGLVSMPGRRARWDDLVIRRRRWSDRIETPSGTPFRSRVSVAPSMYEGNWRDGRIGDDLRRWAPHLCSDVGVPEA